MGLKIFLLRLFGANIGKGLIIKNNVIEIGECTAENIYIENDKNLGGITIPYEFFTDNFNNSFFT